MHREAEAAREPHRSQHPQRVIEESLARRKRSADKAQPQVGRALAGVVLNRARVDVVEKRVDGQVSEDKKGAEIGREARRHEGCAKKVKNGMKEGRKRYSSAVAQVMYGTQVRGN